MSEYTGATFDSTVNGLDPSELGGGGLAAPESILFDDREYSETHTSAPSDLQSVWEGMEGTGTESDPKIITNDHELQAMDHQAAVYKLGANIDASGTAEWSGYFAPVFSKVRGFYGDGHVIKGLTVGSRTDDSKTYSSIFSNNTDPFGKSGPTPEKEYSEVVVQDFILIDAVFNPDKSPEVYSVGPIGGFGAGASLDPYGGVAYKTEVERVLVTDSELYSVDSNSYGSASYSGAVVAYLGGYWEINDLVSINNKFKLYSSGGGDGLNIGGVAGYLLNYCWTCTDTESFLNLREERLVSVGNKVEDLGDSLNNVTAGTITGGTEMGGPDFIDTVNDYVKREMYSAGNDFSAAPNAPVPSLTIVYTNTPPDDDDINAGGFYGEESQVISAEGDNSSAWEALGVTLTQGEMSGAAAESNMSAFDFENDWATLEKTEPLNIYKDGYPIFKTGAALGKDLQPQLNQLDQAIAQGVTFKSFTVDPLLTTDPALVKDPADLALLSDIPTGPTAALVAARPTKEIVDSLADATATTGKPVLVPDGSSLNVYRWGVYQITDATAPTGLLVEIVDSTGTQQASANTTDSTDVSSPVASVANSSGSPEVYRLRINNTTGGQISSPGIGAHYGYLVE